MRVARVDSELISTEEGLIEELESDGLSEEDCCFLDEDEDDGESEDAPKSRSRKRRGR